MIIGTSAMQKDQIVGFVGFAAALVSYVYYAAWVLVTPFVDPSVAWFHSLFPDRYYAFAIPTSLLVIGISLLATFVGFVSLRGR